MTAWLPLLLLFSLSQSVQPPVVNTGPRNFISERRGYQFAGVTQISLNNFDPLDKDVKQASLQFDKNEVAYNSFGDPLVSTVLYKPIEVKLTRLDITDTGQKERRIYALEVPQEVREGLGKNTLRMVTPLGESPQPAYIRLLLVDPTGNVIDLLVLRPVAR